MTENAYKDAGVDIEAGNALVKAIKPHIAKTKRSGVMSGIGGFGALFDLKDTGYRDPILVSGTDGVGTKLKIAINTGRHDQIGIDAVAMCVNDIIVQGAEPLFFLDYFACGKLDNIVAEAVIKGIADGCAQAGCALIGGETAEMPGMYAAGDYDIAGFSVGAVERDQMVTGARIAEGDVILGLASNGLHSNGFSLVRKIIQSTQGFDYESVLDFTGGKTLAEETLIPTRIYVKPLLEALTLKNAQEETAIKGMAHITGGGLTENIPRVLPEGLKAEIDASNWDLPLLFKWLKTHGHLSDDDLALTLNCGIGMIIVVAPDDLDAIKDNLEKAGERVFDIGTVKIRNGSDDPINIINTGASWI